MIPLQKFCLEQLETFQTLLSSDRPNVRKVAEVVVEGFTQDLRDRMIERIRDRIDDLDDEEIIETVVGWIRNMSAAVPSPYDERRLAHSLAQDEDAPEPASAEFFIHFGTININIVPPTPNPPRPLPPSPDKKDHRKLPVPPPRKR